MKTIAVVVGTAFLIIAGVLISLLRSGAALKPAGVIKPAEIGTDSAFIGRQIAVRLFPDFHAAKHVIWRLEGGAEVLTGVPRAALDHYQAPNKPTLIDLRSGSQENCVENCWYIYGMENTLPESVAQITQAGPTAEIFVQYFDRDEKVPESCEREKILTVNCMRSVSVREVRRRIKTPAPHFFMQRYHKSQFYLFIEDTNYGRD